MPTLSNTWLRCGAAAAVVTLSALVHARLASACSCLPPGETDAALASSDVVFEGTPSRAVLVQADLGFPGYTGARRFDFEVTRYFKGQLGPSLSIFTIDQESACGREYSPEPYFIYARYTDTGYLFDALCSNSGPTSLTYRDRAVLGAGVAPDPTVINEWSEPSDDEASVEEEPSEESSGVSSGVNRVPLDSDEGPRGCASSVAPRSASGSKASNSPAWLAVLASGVVLALRVRRRAG